MILVGVMVTVPFGLGRSVIAGSYFPTDGSSPKDFSVLKAGGLWHLIGIHEPGDPPPPAGPGSAGLVHSTSPDLAHWTDVGVAIPVGPTGAWDSYDAWAPSIVKSGDTYYLYYAGVQRQGSQLVQKVGLATSTDLTTWTKDPGNPVFDCSRTSWQYWNLNDADGLGTDCRDPFVIRDEPNNRWVMMYNGRARSDVPEIQNSPLWLPPNPGVVGLATSTDLTHWTDAGYVLATAGYKTESPHAFQHNGTWYLAWTNNCSAWRGGTKCLKVATASSLTGPYSGYDDLPAAGNLEFASEYFTDGATEYFGRVGQYGGWLDFDLVDWSSGSFGLQSMTYGTILGAVWNDLDRNGLEGPDEPGIDRVKLRFYLDDGDGVFDRTKDYYLSWNMTSNLKRLTIPMHGTYRQNYMPPGRIWVEIDPANFDPGGYLAGLVSTTGATVAGVDIIDQSVVTGKSFGFAPPDTTPPAAVTDLQAH